MVFALLAFCIGLFFGSFFLVVIHRFGSNETFLHGRSRCDHCKKILGPFDLIPVFSFITTVGKCRYCKVKLSRIYPLFELLTGILFGFITYFVTSSSQMLNSMFLFHLLFYLFIASCLLLIFFIDLKYGIIPFAIIFPAMLVTFFYLLLTLPTFTTPDQIISSILSASGSFLFFLFLFLITKGRGMGFGDVVYVFFMGLLLGYPLIFVGMYIAFLSGAIISLLLVYLKKKKLHGSTIPFGPFLVLGTFIAWIWGERLFAVAVKILLGM